MKSDSYMILFLLCAVPTNPLFLHPCILAGYIDGSHLIGVTDSGKVFFLNLLKDSAGAFADSGHCGVDVSGLDGTDLEGIAIDHDNWSDPDPNSNKKYAYMVHEGNSGDAATLYKIAYEYDPQGSCSVNVIKSVSLFGSTPCLGSNGIESLTWKETIGDVAYFYAAVQDTGKIYEITSEGTSNGCEYNGGLGMITDISASSYDGKYVWSFYGHKDIIVVVDPVNDCTLDNTYNFPDASDTTDDFSSGQDKEGLIIDVDNGMMYVAIDNGSSNAGAVAAFNFTAPNLGACRRLRRRQATGLFAQASCTTTFDACTCDQLTKGQCDGHSISCSQEGNGNKGKCISSQLPGSTTTTATQVSPTTTNTTSTEASSTTAACKPKGAFCMSDNDCCRKCKQGKDGEKTCN